jgi:hypothetical protein
MINGICWLMEHHRPYQSGEESVKAVTLDEFFAWRRMEMMIFHSRQFFILSCWIRLFQDMSP